MMRGLPLRKLSVGPNPRSRCLALNTLQMRTAFPITRGLVSYWPFQLGGAVDEYGRNHGTVSGATKAIGKYGDALDFNGTSDKVVVLDDPSLSALSSLTVEAWIKCPNQGGFGGTMASKYAAGQREWIFHIEVGTQDLSMVIYDDSANAYILRRKSAASVTDNAWHHVVGVWDGGALPTNIKIYKDAVRIDNVSASGGVFVDIEDRTSDVEIGATAATPQYYTGTIDEVCIYNRVLTADEIRINMNRRRYS